MADSINRSEAEAPKDMIPVTTPKIAEIAPNIAQSADKSFMPRAYSNAGAIKLRRSLRLELT